MKVRGKIMNLLEYFLAIIQEETPYVYEVREPITRKKYEVKNTTFGFNGAYITWKGGLTIDDKQITTFSTYHYFIKEDSVRKKVVLKNIPFKIDSIKPLYINKGHYLHVPDLYAAILALNDLEFYAANKSIFMIFVDDYVNFYPLDVYVSTPYYFTTEIPDFNSDLLDSLLYAIGFVDVYKRGLIKYLKDYENGIINNKVLKTLTYLVRPIVYFAYYVKKKTTQAPHLQASERVLTRLKLPSVELKDVIEGIRGITLRELV